MAKRKKYYQGKKDRMDESRAMKKAMREKPDMLHEDRSAPSNCPMDVMVKMYPAMDYLNAPVADNYQAMDDQANSAVRTARKYMAKKKY